jgi:predicted PurR-regulated permease PerM
MPKTITRAEAGRVAAYAAVVLGIALVAAIAVLAIDVVLLVFAAILVAILLRGLAKRLAEHTPLGPRAALAVVGLAVPALLVAGGWALAHAIGNQFADLAHAIPQAVEALRQRLAAVEWIDRLASWLPSPSSLASGRGDVLGRITGFFSVTLGAFANVLLALAVGTYLAADARLYVDGFARLFPPVRRARVREVLDELGSTLGWWIASTSMSMAVVGLATWAGLALLGFPLAAPLAVIAALLTFIPNLGPLLSVVPALLVALAESPVRALHVLLLYGGIQLVESYLVTPLLQKRMVSLPPALTIVAQVLAGVLFGALGLLLAAPLTATGLVLVRRLYLDGVLGERVEPLGPSNGR